MKTNNKGEFITVINNDESGRLYRTYFGTYDNIYDAVQMILNNDNITFSEFLGVNNKQTKNDIHMQVVSLLKTNKNYYEVLQTKNGVYFDIID